MFRSGWVRCPNREHRWYAGSAGKLEPVFPLELRVTDKVWLVTSRYADAPHREEDLIPIMAFDTPTELEDYLSRNGRKSEVGGPNVWD